MFLKLAWRNLFRNKRRTFIAGTAIGIGLAALIFTDALVIGMKDTMVRSATSTYLGEAQIFHQDFRDTREVEMTVNNLDTVVSQLKNDARVRHFSLRAATFGMITSPANVQAIHFVGIDPEMEKPLSRVDDALTEGTFLKGQNQRDILIGKKLAEILKVGLGDRIVITVAQAQSGDLSQEMFRISGIYHFNVPEMDKGMAFCRLHKAQEMLGLGENVHEIALTFTGTQMGRNKDLPFWDEYSQYGNKAIGWTELLPQMEAALELSDFSTLIIAIILFGVVALGIINTLFMSIHERTFEFGVIRAVGTRPFSVAKLIFFEAGALAIISIFFGNILGLAVTWITGKVGIDYTGIEFAGVTFQNVLYPVLKVDQFISFPFWVFIFTIVIGIYPAVYAARMRPADALRKSM